jgi:3-hydroxyacyl-CoA dehydrogenase
MNVNILGSGYMGKQISALFQLIGFDVFVWHNKNNTDLSNEINKETKKLEKILKIKSLGSHKLETNLSKFENTFTIETVKEDLDIKKKIISSLNFKENIFSNTSSLELSKIGNNVNGFHFMNPVSIKFIELCKKDFFSETLLNFVIKKFYDFSYEIINVKDTPGFLINKIIFKDISYFFYLIEKEKFEYKDVIKIFKSDFKNLNPIRLVNIIGVDTTLHIMENLKKYDSSYYIPEILKEAVDNNILGNKNKKIFKI